MQACVRKEKCFHIRLYMDMGEYYVGPYLEWTRNRCSVERAESNICLLSLKCFSFQNVCFKNWVFGGRRHTKPFDIDLFKVSTYFHTILILFTITQLKLGPNLWSFRKISLNFLKRIVWPKNVGWFVLINYYIKRGGWHRFHYFESFWGTKELWLNRLVI